ncbi:MAG: NADH-quinone oxidoreductase subunit NuoE [Nitrospirota bacterium]
MTDSMTARINELTRKYPDREAALLPALYLAQREYGYITPEAMEFIGETLSIPKATVKGVATFYSMYLHKPVGRHLIQLCTNVSCMVFGAERLVDILRDRYGITPEGTSQDGRFSLVIMECIGACEQAPAMLVNNELHGNLDENNLHSILERYK